MTKDEMVDVFTRRIERLERAVFNRQFQWDPQDPEVVGWFKKLLGPNYMVNGYTLRVNTSDGVAEVYAGDWLEFDYHGAVDRVIRG